jgi:hypothetical protein
MTVFLGPYPAMLAMQLAVIGDLDGDIIEQWFHDLWLPTKKEQQDSMTSRAFSSLMNECKGRCRALAEYISLTGNPALLAPLNADI